jgi:hypothetical protein
MDDAVRQRLVASGWTPGRRVDADNDVVSLFLQEFTGLTLSFVRNGREDQVWFEAARACQWIKRDWIKQYETMVGGTLSPIGYGYHDHMVLLAAEDGRFFGAYDDYVGFLGDSPCEMIANLVTQRIEQL